MNSKIIRVISLILTIFMLGAAFASCKKDGDGNGDGATTTVANTDAPPLYLIENGEAKYAFIYSSTERSEHFMLSYNSFSQKFKDLYGLDIEIKRDSEVPADSAVKEVLIGSTNRAETGKPEGIDENDAWYFVGFIGNKFVVNGSNGYMMSYAVDYLVDNYLSAATETEFSVPQGLIFQKTFPDFYGTDKWLIDEIPAYNGSSILRYSDAIYKDGEHIMLDSKPDELQIAYNTNAAEFNAYVDKIKGYGYEIEYEKAIESNKYISVNDGKTRFYAYFTEARGSVTFVTDNYSTPLDEFCYTTDNVADGMGAQFWLYGINQDPLGWSPDDSRNKSGYPNSGQMQIIKCADNSLIIIDSGGPNQYNNAKFDKFLHHITGKDINEKITISAWYFTHPHGDHVKGAKTFLTDYYKKYDVQRVMSNLATDSFNVGETFRKYYPDCKELKIHTGQTIRLSDVTFDVVYTHEDAVANETGLTTCQEANDNDACAVVRVSTNGMSMLVLGDINVIAEKIIVKAFSGSTLKSDIIQVAHHGLNFQLKSIYEKADADILIFPQAKGAFEDPKGSTALHSNVLKGKHYRWLIENYSSGGAYYAGSYECTSGLVFKGGKIEALTAPNI